MAWGNARLGCECADCGIYQVGNMLHFDAEGRDMILVPMKAYSNAGPHVMQTFKNITCPHVFNSPSYPNLRIPLSFPCSLALLLQLIKAKERRGRKKRAERKVHVLRAHTKAGREKKSRLKAKNATEGNNKPHATQQGKWAKWAKEGREGRKQGHGSVCSLPWHSYGTQRPILPLPGPGTRFWPAGDTYRTAAAINLCKI
jgi:hypothetical protein